MPTFIGHSSPLSRSTKAQGGQGDGGRLELSYITVGSHWTAEAVKHTVADGKGGVECVGIFCADFFLFASDCFGGQGGGTATLVGAMTPGRLLLFVQGWLLGTGRLLG